MTTQKNPPSVQFRRSQVADPINRKRRFAKSKIVKKSFDIYITDIESGEETLAMTVFAVASRDAFALAKKKLHGSKLMRKITYAAFTAVEVEHG
jgi:hypothetical protein